MTHFGPEAWADFARRNLSPEDEHRMQEHLESGCRGCVQTLHLWLGVLDVATGLNVYNPPERGLRFMKALYRAFPPQRCAGSRFDVTRLVLPPFLPATEGVRSTEPAHRHFVFQRGNVLLEIDIDLHPDSGEISMAGQLMDPVAPASRFDDRLVTLLSENSELVHTHTNQFGEFQMEFHSAADLLLVIHLEAQAVLVTPLPSFVLARTQPDTEIELLPEKNDASN
jgi:hypothetical protein